jgi:hypothetical protein
MSGGGASDQLRVGWIAKAQELDRGGYFREYTAKQRADVLRRGYVGPVRPDEGIQIATGLVEAGYYYAEPKIVGELRGQFEIVGSEEIREVLLAVLRETPASTYEPPHALKDPPGYPFIFPCARLGCALYFKFQITGTAKKRQVVFCSCHVPIGGVSQ